MRGKMSRTPFPKASEKKYKHLECVVSDICGPFSTESIGKSKYFATFIDVHSGFTKVVFLRTRDELPDKAIEFIEEMKTQFGKTIQIFRSDRGTEYLGEKLQSYLRKNGILTQCTVARSSAQNGICERKNRTLTEAARTLMISSGMSKRLWAEAVHHANDVFNNIPRGAENATPHELLYHKPSKIDFHEFGCDVYVLNTNQKRKLDEKSELMRYVGNDKRSKGFRVMTQTGKVIIVRDVKFVEKSRRGEVQVDSNSSESENEEETDCKSDENSEEPDRQQPEKTPEKKSIQDSSGQKKTHEKSIQDSSGQMKTHEKSIQDSSNQMKTHEKSIQDSSDQMKTHEKSIQDSSEHKKIQEKSPSTPCKHSDDETEHFETPKASEVPQHSRPKRITQPPARYGMMSHVIVKEPESFKEVLNSPEKDKWMEAIHEELNSIEENETWELTDLPPGRKSIGSKWVFTLKKDETGAIAQYKARLVAQGFTQKYNVDYFDVFAPVARPATLRALLSFAGKNNYVVKQYDVKTAFLNGKLDEEIYLRQPPGFKSNDQVYRLKKSLYGLKQAAKVWNDTLTRELSQMGFKQSEADKCIFVLSDQNDLCYLLVHVDDMLIASSNKNLIEKCANSIGKCFKIKDLGMVKHYLGIDVSRDEKGNFMLSQTPYIEKILEVSGMVDARHSKFPLDSGYYRITDENHLEDNHEYRKLIGMLLYLAVHSRPDIAASVNILSQKTVNPRVTDYNEVKRVIKYLAGTKNHRLALSRENSRPELVAYTDANWAEEPKARKSNSGFYCSLNGGAISWYCRRQELVTLSSTEAEFVALSEACKETIWLQRLLNFFPSTTDKPICMNVDNQSCLKMVANDKFSNRTKHIDTKFYFSRDCVSQGHVKLKYVATEHNLADLFTKPLQSTRIKYLRELVGLIEGVTSLRDGVEI
jgi:hypothetical protein